eukprot:190687-Ditylum_brightwellii.AAC.1
MRVIDLILQRYSRDTSIKWNTVTILAHTINKSTMPRASRSYLIKEWRKTRKNFYHTKKKSNSMCSNLCGEKTKVPISKGKTW